MACVSICTTANHRGGHDAVPPQLAAGHSLRQAVAHDRSLYRTLSHTQLLCTHAPASGTHAHVSARRCALLHRQEGTAILLAVAPVKTMDTGLPAASENGTTVTSLPVGTGSVFRVANCAGRGSRQSTDRQHGEAGEANDVAYVHAWAIEQHTNAFCDSPGASCTADSLSWHRWWWWSRRGRRTRVAAWKERKRGMKG